MEDYTSPAPTSSWHMKAVAAALGVGLLGFGGYAMHEHSVASQAAQQNAQVSASLQTTNQQVAALTSKLSDIEAQRAAEAAKVQAALEAQQHAAASRKAKVGAGHAMRRDDPRWKKMQEQLAAQQAAINSTNQNLDSAKTELSGSIAKTHDELVVLQRKGERNYFEFDLTKDKAFHPQGPIGLRLRKANSKHSYADLELLVDDRSMTQKHVNLLQPTVFYAADSEAPVEIVINSITKDHIHGYVSAPKYRRSELAASQTQTVTPVDPHATGPSLKTRGTSPN
jgi:transcriptional regulator with PAS, ATPase and Fis domain